VKPLFFQVASAAVVFASLAGCAGNAGDPAMDGSQTEANSSVGERRRSAVGELSTSALPMPPLAMLEAGTCVEFEMCMNLSHFDFTACTCVRNPSCTCDADCDQGECVDDPLNPGTKVCSRPPRPNDGDDGDDDRDHQ
jgi:hypothetical protein